MALSTGYQLWKQLCFPCAVARLWILAESLFQSVAFICPSIPGQSVELFVCLSQSCQPPSLTNPSFSASLSLSLSLSLSVLPTRFLSCLQCPRQPGLIPGAVLAGGSSSSSALYFSAELIFILSDISNNFPTTTAGPGLHASCLSLVGAYNMMWLDNVSLSTWPADSGSLSSGAEQKKKKKHPTIDS